MATLFRRYPTLGPARVLDALSFAYDNLELIEADIAREQRMFVAKGGPSVGARPLAQLPLPFDELEAPSERDQAAFVGAQTKGRAASGDGRAAKR